MSNDDGSRRVTDEPTQGELMRAIQQLRAEAAEGRRETNGRLDKVLTVEAFNQAFGAEQRRVDGRFKDLVDDIAAVTLAIRAEAAERKEAVTAEAAARKEAIGIVTARLDRTANMLRWLAAAIVLPIALFIGSIFFARGGTL